MKVLIDIDNAIIIYNAKQLELNKPTIKDKKHLAQIIFNKYKIFGNVENVYMRLYRAQNKGFLTDKNTIIPYIAKELNISKERLIKSSI